MLTRSQNSKKPKTLAEIDKHFRLSSTPQRKTKVDLKTKGIRPLQAKLRYTEHFQQKLMELGLVMVCRHPKSAKKDSARRAR